MRLPPLIKGLGLLSILMLTVMSSCRKESELYAFEGRVFNTQNEPVVSAQIQIFKSPNDWLTGHNVLLTMSSDMIGHFESSKAFEAGDYYIFVEKYDTSNWNIRDVEKGIYPKITLPTDGEIQQFIEPSNMALLANTNWKIVNVLEEYTQSGHTAIQWRSIWSNMMSCKKDNTLKFGKDLSLNIGEGPAVCVNAQESIIGTFVPPMIFSSLGCDKLPNTSQKVKPFEFSGWDYMENRSAEMYLACDQSVGQIYIYFNGENGKMLLHVYDRTN